MESKWAIPVLASILILGVIGFSNEAYSSPVGDEIGILVMGFDIKSFIQTTVGPGPEFTAPLTVLPLPSVSVDVGDSGIWLNYELNPSIPIPSHGILIQDLDWIDPDTQQPIPGQIVDVRCPGGQTFFTPDILIITFPSFPPGLDEVHCEFDTEHEDPTIDVVIDVKPTIDVVIDVKPNSDPNCFNSDGHGVIPVAILGSATFVATQVDPLTISLDSQAVKFKGNGDPQTNIEDVNGDGFEDLVVKIIDIDSTYIVGTGIATLTGQLFDGTPIEATDSICITQ